MMLKRTKFVGLLFCILLVSVSSVVLAGSQCMYSAKENSIVLSNGLCKIVWNKTAQGWAAQYQCKVDTGWQTVALDDLESEGAYGVLFQGGKTTSNYIYGGTAKPGDIQQALPAVDTLPQVVHQSDDEIQLKWCFEIIDRDGEKWPIESTFRIRRGDWHIHEDIHFQAPVYRKVRYQRGWIAKTSDVDFFEKIVNSPSHHGWTVNNASFMVVADQGPDGWDATTGGGSFVRYGKGFKLDQAGSYIPAKDDAVFVTIHRVPHVIEQDGWVDTRYFDHYTLRHDLMMYPGTLYKRDVLDYLHKLRPPEKLPPRYSWKRFLDLQIEGLKNAPKELFEDHGDWGHNELGWFNGFNDPKCTPKHTFLQVNRQSLDWGGNWDLWQAISLREYGLRYEDKWALERAGKLFNGIKREMWQIDDAGTACDGAFWMFRPRTQTEYEERKATKLTGEQGGHIRKSADLWVCDSGKIGYWLAEMSQQLDDNEFLEKAKRAATFLLNLQQEDGNLRAGRIHISGTMVYPANLATNSSAIMLWARLYEITKDAKYKQAALKCADYSISKWLNGKVWKMHGGEWDVPGNTEVSSASYAAWGFSILYRATKYPPALTAVRRSADWMSIAQSLFDTHIGFYMPKTYWRGRDAKMTGGLIMSTQPLGYGQIPYNRSEPPYAWYLAWKATGDELYLESAKAYLVWQTYMQHNCPYDYRFHGGGSEGFEMTIDNMNGFGTVYIGETIGCDIALFALMDEEIIVE